MELINIKEEEFNQISELMPLANFHQTTSWAKLKANNNWVPYYLGLKNNNHIIATAMLLKKKIPLLNKNMFYCPRGFLCNYNDQTILTNFTYELKQFIQKENGIFLKIDPFLIYKERDINGDIVENGINNSEVVNNLKALGYKHNGFTINSEDLQPRFAFVLDLNKSEDEIFENMRNKTKASIKASYKHGLKLVEINQNRMIEYKDLMVHTSSRRGFIDRPLTYYNELYDNFKDNHIKVLLVELYPKQYINNLNKIKSDINNNITELNQDLSGAKAKRLLKEKSIELNNITKRINELEEIKDKEKITIAGGLFILYKDEITSLFGASYKEYMKFDGQYFLNYEMIKYALKNHYKRYNFYGITGNFQDKENKMYGLYDFKKGFGGHVEEYIGEFDLIINKFYYNLYKKMFKAYHSLKNIKR